MARPLRSGAELRRCRHHVASAVARIRSSRHRVSLPRAGLCQTEEDTGSDRTEPPARRDRGKWGKLTFGALYQVLSKREGLRIRR